MMAMAKAFKMMIADVAADIYGRCCALPCYSMLLLLLPRCCALGEQDTKAFKIRR